MRLSLKRNWSLFYLKMIDCIHGRQFRNSRFHINLYALWGLLSYKLKSKLNLILKHCKERNSAERLVSSFFERICMWIMYKEVFLKASNVMKWFHDYIFCIV